MPLYAYTLLGSIVVPLLYSVFIKDFIKNWKPFIISTTTIAAIFLIWDVIFTKNKVWGFNEDYLLNIDIINLPVEEWLFFFIIPFCSLFIHFALYHVYPNLKLSKKVTYLLAILLILLSLSLLMNHYQKDYTFVNFSLVSFILLLSLYLDIKLLRQFFISFLIILIPFFIVNGILTGAITTEPIVWYDNSENLGIRILTIPVEDIGYAFTMLLSNLMLFNYLINNKKT